METIDLMEGLAPAYHDWQYRPVGLVDTKSMDEAFKWCEAYTQADPQMMIAVYVMFNAVVEHYNRKIAEQVEAEDETK